MHHESPYGPLHIWWTEQDLLSPLGAAAHDPSALQAYARLVVKDYLDVEGGHAKLTDEVPWNARPIKAHFGLARVVLVLSRGESSTIESAEWPLPGKPASVLLVAVNVLAYLAIAGGIYFGVRWLFADTP